MNPTSSKLYYSVCPLLPWNLQSHIPPNLSSIYLYLISLYLSRSQTSIQFRKLPVQPQGRQRQTHPKMLVDLKLKDSETSHRPFLLGQTARVSNRPVDSTKKQVHLGWLHMRPIWWHLQNHLTIPEALEKVPPPPPKSLHPYLKWWLQEANVQGWHVHPLSHALQIVTATDNTTVVVYINKEGGMRLGPLCALLWSILTWCSRKWVTLKAQNIPSQLNVVAEKLSRLNQFIQIEWSLLPEAFNMICKGWHQACLL